MPTLTEASRMETEDLPWGKTTRVESQTNKSYFLGGNRFLSTVASCSARRPLLAMDSSRL